MIETDSVKPDDIHVYPLFGTRPHIVSGDGWCWCQPERDQEVPSVIVHNVEH